jgi:hypothetical protein
MGHRRVGLVTAGGAAPAYDPQKACRYQVGPYRPEEGQRARARTDQDDQAEHHRGDDHYCEKRPIAAAITL